METSALMAARVSHRSTREEGEGVRVQASVQKQEGKEVHESVMTSEALRALSEPEAGSVVLDATAGQGGHSLAILEHTEARVLALDADPEAVAIATKRVAKFKKRATVVESNFSEIEKVLRKQGVEELGGALFDLGWNSGQLDSGRGFSFLHDEPLNMSYGKKPASGFTAREAINQWDEKTLADVFYGYGEERYAKRIAKAVVARRALQPIKTTLELVEIITDSVPAAYRRGRLHPATRSFQALRMAVNDELGVIEKGLRAAWAHLSPGSCLVVITFHSIEDRLVKQLFKEFVQEGGALLYKKPLVPSRAEITHNPRARSAKLRAICTLTK